ncbi:hypothetical protein NQ315_017566 [Exocentrus adspersus]|uniref:DDE-1 domain-containing protein n=1 Tax=Exocentrus adspersus TaxID=1586481 RepID=A0AAV8VJG4_9CUCU|nr:hypothetical protein NQ315_017566 [Exocentrus adspersus]
MGDNPEKDKTVGCSLHGHIVPRWRAVLEDGLKKDDLAGIPRATVHDKFTGKSPAEKKKTEPPPLLTVEGEKKIADWAINIAKCGFPISKTDLMEAVAKIATDTEGINKARALITEEHVRSWFCGLRKYMEDNNFQDVLEDPSRIFNGDVSGFSLCSKSGKVLGPKGWKNLYVVKSGKEKENITVLITFNASGAVCSPLVVFSYVRPPKALVENVPRNWVIGKSDSDGHKSHMTLPLSRFCKQQDIILYALPPNTTHILQPADVSVFKPMKQEWKDTVKN